MSLRLGSFTPRSRHLLLAAALTTLLVPMLACGFGDDGHTVYPLEVCGMQIQLGSHFSQTESGPDRYVFSTDDASSIVEIERGLPGDPAGAREPTTFLAAGVYDYDRTSTIAGFPAREVRTQVHVGALIRSRWGAAIDTPRGLCYLRVTNLVAMPPDEFGESFWTSLHDRWLTPL